MDNSNDAKTLDKKGLRKTLIEQRMNMPDRQARGKILRDVTGIWLVGRPETVIGDCRPIKG